MTYAGVPATVQRTAGLMDEVLHSRATNLEQASQLSGVGLDDLRKLQNGSASAIRFSTLAALCSALNCTPEEILRVQDQPKRMSAVATVFRRMINYQSSALSAVALLAGAIIAVWLLVGAVSRVNPVDFYVYHYAASLAWSGQNIYSGNIQGPDMPAGGLPFTYTPFAALILAPLALLPAHLAYGLWSLGSALLMGTVLRRLLPTVHRNKPFIVGSLGLAASGTIVMASHIIFGQINVFLMALVLFDVCRPRQSGLWRRLPPGVLIGIAAAVKLTPALFIVYFIVSRQGRAAAGSVIAVICATVLGFVSYQEMSWDFFTSVLWTLSDRVSLEGFFATSGNNSIQGALAALGNWTAFPALIPTLAIAVLGLYAATMTYRRGERVQAAIVVGLTACLASPVSWMHHWVYLLPGLVILWRQGGRKTRLFCYSSATILLATGPNLGDVILSLHQPLLLPLGIVLRESLLLIGVIGAALLARQSRPETKRAVHKPSIGYVP